MYDTDLAWLAGLIDGEGSIGLARQSHSYGYQAAVQLNMTHKPTIEHAAAIIVDMGIRGLHYQYTYKNGMYKDAHLLKVHRLWDVRLIARNIIGFSITKRIHWELILEYAESRLEGAALTFDGRIVRGGNVRHQLTEREHEIAALLTKENRRGNSNANSAAAGTGDLSAASTQRIT